MLYLLEGGAAVKMKIKWLVLTAAALMLLTGCSIRTSDQLYSLPKRSQTDGNLQSVIESAMNGLEYCAPLTGENQQAVQMADLDGDGASEFILYAKGGTERPLRILIFRYDGDEFYHAQTIESTGSAFDQVEYVQFDGKAGMEIVVGRQLDAQVIRSVSVYSFSASEAQQLLTAGYTKCLTVDLDSDSMVELFVLRPGLTDTDPGIAELYDVKKDAVERSNQVNMSESVSALKRILVGQLYGGQTAVYVASAVGDNALITDVYAIVDNALTNVSVSNESGTSVQTMRNYYIYADDIDNDNVVELPQLMSMSTLEQPRSTDRQDLIRWYAMTATGAEVDKMFTYHNFVGGWYLQLEDRWAKQLSVQRQGNIYEFYIQNGENAPAKHILNIYIFTGQNRDVQATLDGRFLLHKTDSAVYAASLGPKAEQFGIDQDYIIRCFHLIRLDWKTGET